MFSYRYGSIAFLSEIELELPAASSHEMHQHSVVIQRADQLPAPPHEIRRSGPVSWYKKSLWLQRDPSLHAHITERKIIYATTLGTSQATLARFIQEAALPYFLSLHDVFPLHASAVALNDREAAVFLGKSGDGKSTLAAAYAKRGAPLIADDVVLVFPSKDGAVRISGLDTVVALAPDSERFVNALDNAQSPRIGPGNRGKTLFRVPMAKIGHFFSPKEIFVLNPAESSLPLTNLSERALIALRHLISPQLIQQVQGIQHLRTASALGSSGIWKAESTEALYHQLL